MLDWILIIMAVTMGSGGSMGSGATVDNPAEASLPSGFTAKPQVPTGKFTTATEIKPIMEMTRPNWLALSAQPGNDFLYVTQIWSWRCGLLQMKVSVNGAAMEVWPLPPCHEETNAPNAILESDGLPFRMFGAGEIEQIEVELLYDDLTTTSATYTRQDILMP